MKQEKYIGMDVHQATISVAVTDQMNGVLSAWLRYEVDPPSLLAILLPHHRNLRVRAEFLVIAIGLFDILVIALEQRHPRVEVELNVFGQPHFIIYVCQLNQNPRAFVDPGEHEAKRNRIDGGDIELHP